MNKCYKTTSLLIIFSLALLISVGCKNDERGSNNSKIKKLSTKNMAFIEKGEFIFGVDKVDTKDAPFVNARVEGENAKPKQKIFLDSYYIDIYETTYKEFKNYQPRHEYPEGVDNHPVIYVTWNQADAYCKAQGKKLPSEEQWEKAARGTDGRLYTWGNTFDAKLANITEKIMPVGSFKTDKSVYGVYDMVGNVSEWTESWYKPYKGAKYESEEFGETFKVSRGGSYNDTGHYFLSLFSQVVFRYFNLPVEAGMDNGFRCASAFM